ncbi:MAG: ATP-dependent RNA helicase RhlE [Salibacteraceae bacterium]|jgi:ATP-dependent RNA helicase RhlE
MTFESLGLSKPVLKAVAEKGYTEPSPIQEKAIPVVLEEKDILASAQTGTGKTAGFVLPIIEMLTWAPNRAKQRKIRALVLTPTRELAAQIYDNAREYSKYVDFRTAVVFGGVKQRPQEATLRQGVDLLVATPGRLLDLESQGVLSLRNVEILVLDEADRMLDMGFKRDIDKIMALVPKQRQTLLFSATFSKEIKKLAQSTLRNPVLVEATPENTTVEKINQKVYYVDKNAKPSVLIKLIKEGDWQQILVFTRTKHGANKLTKSLISAEISASAIHGNKTQNNRIKALKEFKAGDIKVLVATDIAARGLDIPLLPHVVNYELPNIPEDYVHRIGRTGRAGAKGEAISLVEHEEKDYLRNIQNLIEETIDNDVIEGFEPQVNSGPTKPKAKQQGRGGGGGGRPSGNRPKASGSGSGGGNRNKYGKKPSSGGGNRSSSPRQNER